MFSIFLTKSCFGALTVGTTIALPILLTQGVSGGAVVSQNSLEQAASQSRLQTTRNTNQVEREATPKEQIEKDLAFDECQRENLKFLINDGNGGTKWINSKEYSPSKYGSFLEFSYDENLCSREVTKK